MVEYCQVNVRRNSSGNWLKANPILRERELAADTIEKRVRLGDGLTVADNLDWCDDTLVDILASDFNV